MSPSSCLDSLYLNQTHHPFLFVDFYLTSYPGLKDDQIGFGADFRQFSEAREATFWFSLSETPLLCLLCCTRQVTSFLCEAPDRLRTVGETRSSLGFGP